MKTRNTIPALVAIVTLAGLSIETSIAKDKDQAALNAKAKVTKEAAQKTALTKAPDGTVKNGELEEENGKLIWSFDIARPGTKNITEVQVDAISGKVVNVAVETPADQAKEAQEDKKKAKTNK